MQRQKRSGIVAAAPRQQPFILVLVVTRSQNQKQSPDGLPQHAHSDDYEPRLHRYM